MRKYVILAVAFLTAGAALFFTPLEKARADNQNRSIYVCNYYSTGWDNRIIHVYATRAGRTDWGEDRLDGHINGNQCRAISPGATGGDCIVDWLAETANGRRARIQLNACDELQWPIRNMR